MHPARAAAEGIAAESIAAESTLAGGTASRSAAAGAAGRRARRPDPCAASTRPGRGGIAR